jgi:hypothetical protein
MCSLSFAVKVRRRGRSDNSADTETALIGVWSMGMSEMILPRRRV